MKKIVLAALLTGVSGAAFAADLPQRTFAPAAAVYAPTPFSWTGVYVGANAGYAYGVFPTAGKIDSFANPSGGEIGGTVGYNYQYGHFVFGGEGDLGYNNLKATQTVATGTTKASVGWMATERLRAGFAVDRALLYVTGGLAQADVEGQFANKAGIGKTQKGWRTGGVIGGGVEYALTNNVSLKAEYLYAPLQSKQYFPTSKAYINTALDLSLFRVGVNYKF